MLFLQACDRACTGGSSGKDNRNQITDLPFHLVCDSNETTSGLAMCTLELPSVSTKHFVNIVSTRKKNNLGGVKISV